MRNYLASMFCALAAFTFVGCGNEGADSAPPAEPNTTTPAETPAEAPAAPAETPAEAPAEEGK